MLLLVHCRLHAADNLVLYRPVDVSRPKRNRVTGGTKGMASRAVQRPLRIDDEASAAIVLPTSCAVLRGETGILAASSRLENLRNRSEQDADVTTDPKWFVAMAAANKTIPWVVELFEGPDLVAAMFLAERCVVGLPSGYLKADGGFGDEFLICAPDRRDLYFPLLLRGLFEHRAALIAHIPQPAESGTAHARLGEADRIDVEWKSRTSHHRLPLASTMEETLAPYGCAPGAICATICASQERRSADLPPNCLRKSESRR
jgi:hypothetical protein